MTNTALKQRGRSLQVFTAPSVRSSDSNSFGNLAPPFYLVLKLRNFPFQSFHDTVLKLLIDVSSLFSCGFLASTATFCLTAPLPPPPATNF